MLSLTCESFLEIDLLIVFLVDVADFFDLLDLREPFELFDRAEF